MKLNPALKASYLSILGISDNIKETESFLGSSKPRVIILFKPSNDFSPEWLYLDLLHPLLSFSKGIHPQFAGSGSR